MVWQGGQLVPIRGPFEFDVVDVWGDGKGKAVAFVPRHAPDELYLAFRGVRNEMQAPPSSQPHTTSQPPPSSSEMQASLPPAEAGGGSDVAAAVAPPPPPPPPPQQQQQQQYDTGPSVDRSNFVRFECEEPAWLAGTALKVRARCMCMCTACGMRTVRTKRCMCMEQCLEQVHAGELDPAYAYHGHVSVPTMAGACGRARPP